jgi:long-chain acyl-CoA synthetase
MVDLTSGHGLSQRLAALLALPGPGGQMSYHGTWHSWDAIRARADAVARATAAIPPDAPVAVVCRNHPFVLGAVLGLLRDGRCIVPVAPLHRDELVAAELWRLAPSAVVLTDTDDSRPALSKAAAASSDLVLRIATDAGVRSGVDVRAPRPLDNARAQPYPPETAVVLQTSGTTGPAKQIPLSYTSLAASINAMQTRVGHRGDAWAPRLRQSVAILNTPISHVSGLLAFCLNVAEGRRLALLDRFEPLAWSQLVHDHRVASAGVPPAALAMMLDAEIAPDLLTSLRVIRTGTAPLDPGLALRFERTYRVPVIQAYGATEFGGVASWTLADHQKWVERKRGSVGRVHPGVEVRLVDPSSGEPVAAGAEGRLEVRTEQAAVHADGDGWLRTSDRARLDEDGFLWITGRTDDVINRGGLKVDAGSVAAQLMTLPDVADAAVVGVPDQRLGEVPCAVVVLRSGDAQPGTEQQLREALRKKLPAYAVPSRFAFVPQLPRTGTLKLDRPSAVALFTSAARPGD